MDERTLFYNRSCDYWIVKASTTERLRHDPYPYHLIVSVVMSSTVPFNSVQSSLMFQPVVGPVELNHPVLSTVNMKKRTVEKRKPHDHATTLSRYQLGRLEILGGRCGSRRRVLRQVDPVLSFLIVFVLVPHADESLGEREVG